MVVQHSNYIFLELFQHLWKSILIHEIDIEPPFAMQLHQVQLFSEHQLLPFHSSVFQQPGDIGPQFKVCSWDVHEGHVYLFRTQLTLQVGHHHGRDHRIEVGRFVAEHNREVSVFRFQTGLGLLQEGIELPHAFRSLHLHLPRRFFRVQRLRCDVRGHHVRGDAHRARASGLSVSRFSWTDQSTTRPASRFGPPPRVTPFERHSEGIRTQREGKRSESTARKGVPFPRALSSPLGRGILDPFMRIFAGIPSGSLCPTHREALGRLSGMERDTHSQWIGDAFPIEKEGIGSHAPFPCSHRTSAFASSASDESAPFSRMEGILSHERRKQRLLEELERCVEGSSGTTSREENGEKLTEDRLEKLPRTSCYVVHRKGVARKCLELLSAERDRKQQEELEQLLSSLAI
eukprot:scaffold155_cov347-Pavlova_lutheri.AAC.8